MKNLFSDIPRALPAELIEIFVENKEMRVERIVSRGHTSPGGFWYDQDRNEFVLLIRGAARLKFAEKKDIVELKPGDYLFIPARQRHRVEWTLPQEDTVWLAIHY